MFGQAPEILCRPCRRSDDGKQAIPEEKASVASKGIVHQWIFPFSIAVDTFYDFVASVRHCYRRDLVSMMFPD
jgi:hypothetical protein